MCLLVSLLAVGGQRAIDDFSEFFRRVQKMVYLLIALDTKNMPGGRQPSQEIVED